ncbi:SpoIIE family protein phosphatase [Streptomyces sp. NPDC003374]
MTTMADTTVGDRVNPRESWEVAAALVDDRGTVVAWTPDAQRLTGHLPGDVVGRPAALVLPCAEQCRARGGWSGRTAVRHRDGHTLELAHRVSRLSGRDGSSGWLVSLADSGAGPSEAADGPTPGSLLVRAPVGIVLRDERMLCTWVNDTMERHDGIGPERRLGHRLSDAWPDTKAEGLETLMRQVLRDGTTRVHEFRRWLPAGPRREHTFAGSFFALQGADGQALGVCVISVDVTETRRAQERFTILRGASARLAGSPDVMHTSQELADLAVALFADYAVVDLEQSVPFGKGPPVHIGTSGEHPPTFRRSGLASVHHGVPESPWRRGQAVHLPPGSPFSDVLRRGRPHLEPILDTAPGTWIDKDPARASKVRENGAHSLMAVPIRVRRTLLGVAWFLRTDNPVPFQEIDLLLAEELVRRAAQSLDEARQHAREHTAALALQRTLLPHRLRGGMAVDAAARYLPADVDSGVGGDWFDVIPLSGARVALVVGDVVGHGLRAAATMGRLRTAVHTLAHMELPPDELLTHLDDTVQRLAEEDPDTADQPPGVVGATCLYAVYDPVTGVCTMAAAGHPPPAVLDPRGRVTFPDLPAGAPLGIGLAASFEAVELELDEGTLLALYTDGLVESRDDDIDVGMRRLASVLAQPAGSLEDLCARATDVVPGQVPPDDVTLLLVRTHSLDPARVASWTLPGDCTAVRAARRLVTRQLTDWGLRDLEDSTTLIVSELVTNAVRHAAGPIVLRLIQHDVLTCEVSDTSVDVPRLRRARTLDENGRGLFLIAQLSHRWGTRCVPNGKVVWAEQDLTGASSR